MVSYGQRRLNRGDVRKATRDFVLFFLALTAISFLTVFLFFKSSDMQNREMRKELDAYHDMIGRNNLLKIKMDSIYYKMSLLNNDKVNNDIFLRNQIIEDMNVSKQMIAGDSAVDLRHYSMLLSNIEPMLNYKNELMKLKTEENAISRNLQNCLGNMGKVTTHIKAKQELPKGKLFRNAR